MGNSAGTAGKPAAAHSVEGLTSAPDFSIPVPNTRRSDTAENNPNLVIAVQPDAGVVVAAGNLMLLGLILLILLLLLAPILLFLTDTLTRAYPVSRSCCRR